MVQLLKRAFGLDKKVLTRTETAVAVVEEKPQLLPQEWPTIIIEEDDITHDTVVAAAFGGFGEGAYEYGKNTDRGLIGFQYQESPVFSNLNPDTEYTFTARKKSDGVYEGTRLAERVSVRTKPAPQNVQAKQFVKAV